MLKIIAVAACVSLMLAFGNTLLGGLFAVCIIFVLILM
jgi:hypothetical protein